MAAPSQTLEEKFEEMLRIHAEKKAQIDYLRRQLEERQPRRSRWPTQHHMDFKVEIPEFEAQLNPDGYLDWLSTVERVFEYKDIPDEKKVKLVVLKLGRDTSIWWNEVLSKRAREGKEKIHSWRKMNPSLRLGSYALLIPPNP